MLNLHFSLLPFDWHFNPLFIPCHCCFFVRQNRHVEDMAKVTNFRRIASLYASDIHKKLIDGITGYYRVFMWQKRKEIDTKSATELFAQYAVKR